MQFITHRMMFEITPNYFYNLRHTTKVDIRGCTRLRRRPVEHGNYVFFLKRDLKLEHMQEGFTHFPPHLPCLLILAAIRRERVLIKPCKHRHDNHTSRVRIRILKSHTQGEIL